MPDTKASSCRSRKIPGARSVLQRGLGCISTRGEQEFTGISLSIAGAEV